MYAGAAAAAAAADTDEDTLGLALLAAKTALEASGDLAALRLSGLPQALAALAVLPAAKHADSLAALRRILG